MAVSGLVCTVCDADNDDKNALLCDGCSEGVCHTYCATPRLDSVPGKGVGAGAGSNAGAVDIAAASSVLVDDAANNIQEHKSFAEDSDTDGRNARHFK